MMSIVVFSRKPNGTRVAFDPAVLVVDGETVYVQDSFDDVVDVLRVFQ
jgi:outer membrane lipoprotein-sorting protein